MSMEVDACDLEAIRALAHQGSSEALDRVAACYLDRLRGVGRCACGDAASAEDAVQDAMVSALQALPGYRGEGSVVAWMSTMVVNACRARRRGRKHDPAWHAELHDDVVAHDAATDHCAARAELVDRLGEALGELTAEERWLFLMSEQEGRDAPALGAELGLAPTAVRARLTRIRKKLRRRLEGVWADWHG